MRKIVAKTADPEVADELLFFAMREDLQLEYRTLRDLLVRDCLRTIIVTAEESEVDQILDFMANGPFAEGDFIEMPNGPEPVVYLDEEDDSRDDDDTCDTEDQ